jgi:hypothetical protein
MRLPSDRVVLQAIYDRYHDQFVAYDPAKPDRSAKILVPIDCDELGKELKVDPDIVFGRLYYHFEEKYGHEDEDGILIPFFARVAGKDGNCINFPLMASVLAGMQEAGAAVGHV